MNVLVTGAGRGIGRALALSFGRPGNRVAVNYRRSRAGAEEVVREIRARGAEAEAIQADVSDPAQARALVESAGGEGGRLDGLIVNAGVTRDRTLLKMTEQEWREVIDVNLSGAFWCLQAAGRLMSRRKDGFILLVSSSMALRGGFGCANYAASKAGLIALAKSAARELGRFNVRVNAVLPGYHSTDMNAALPPDQVERVRSEHLLGRLPDLAELGDFVRELAAKTSVSGQVFNFESRIL